VIFELSIEQIEDLTTWVDTHDCDGEGSDLLTYCFNPTVSGSKVPTEVKCACGDSIDLTDAGEPLPLVDTTEGRYELLWQTNDD
jgi:hypothetical protein